MKGDDDNGDAPDDDAPAEFEAPRRFDAEERDLSGDNDEALLLRLHTLEQEHRDLDAAILSLEGTSGFNRLSLQRMKKRKLALKDLMSAIRDRVTPDIIA